MKTILEAKNVGKSFVGVQALKNINIEIKMGEIHCLACTGVNALYVFPFMMISPKSGVYTPAKHLTNVDFPHPFSPARQ